MYVGFTDSDWLPPRSFQEPGHQEGFTYSPNFGEGKRPKQMGNIQFCGGTGWTIRWCFRVAPGVWHHSSMWSQPMLFWWLRVHRTVRVHERWSGTRDFENWMDTCHRDVNSWMTICKIRRNLFCDLDFIYCCLGYLWINWKPQSTQTTAVIRCEC